MIIIVFVRKYPPLYCFLLNSKRMTNNFDDFLNAIRKDPQVRVKISEVLKTYNRYPNNYHSKIGYDALIQNVVLKELINKMGTTITDLDIELKTKISRIKNLEIKTNS